MLLISRIYRAVWLDFFFYSFRTHPLDMYYLYVYDGCRVALRPEAGLTMSSSHIYVSHRIV